MVFDPSRQLICAADADELDRSRQTLRGRLDEAGVHPAIAREMMLAFTEVATPRAAVADDSKVISDLAISRDELVLRVQTSSALCGTPRETGEQDLMLHLLADDVTRVVDGDQVAITVRKRRLGR